MHTNKLVFPLVPMSRLFSSGRQRCSQCASRLPEVIDPSGCFFCRHFGAVRCPQDSAAAMPARLCRNGRRSVFQAGTAGPAAAGISHLPFCLVRKKTTATGTLPHGCHDCFLYFLFSGFPLIPFPGADPHRRNCAEHRRFP